MSIHVHIEGQGSDLVLLHGWAMHGGVFADIIPMLTQQYRVHAIDLPGHGQSGFDDSITTLDQITQCIAPHVPQHAIILGWSLGGQVALQLVNYLSLRALILVSTTPRFVATEDWPQGMNAAVFAQFFARLHQNLEGTVQDFLSLQVRGDIHAMNTLKTLRNRLLQYPPHAQALQLGLNILRDTDLRGILPAIREPALLIAGEHDRIVHPRATRYAAEHLSHSQYVEISRAGHASFISHREEFLNAVNSFLMQLPLAGAA